jgi:hypothetical protein
LNGNIVLPNLGRATIYYKQQEDRDKNQQA